MNFTIFLIALAVVLVSVSSKTWTPDPNSKDSVIVGIGSTDATHAVAGSCNTNTGPEPSFYADGEWTKTHNFPFGLILDVAGSPANKVSVAASFSQILVSHDQGGNWASVPKLIGLSQSVQSFDGA